MTLGECSHTEKSAHFEIPSVVLNIKLLVKRLSNYVIYNNIDLNLKNNEI